MSFRHSNEVTLDRVGTTGSLTEIETTRLVAIASESMHTGMAVVEAPSGRMLYQNEASVRLFGPAPREVRSKRDYDAFVAYVPGGRRIASNEWPIARALEGEVVANEHVEIEREGRRRTLRISASPVRDSRGVIVAAVATYDDVTEARRAHESAAYLAAAGAVLERFDPDASLQAIIDLAVPVLADWCFVHVVAPDGPARVVAIANGDPAKVADARERTKVPRPLSRDTAVWRVLAGGPPEIVQVDDEVLAKAESDPATLERLRSQGYTSAVVAPLTGREGVLGAITFSMAESGRRYADADLATLVELARRTGIALDNARLLAAERRARQHAEEARDATRRLQRLTEKLSAAVVSADVVSVMVSAGRDALGADAGFAWLVRDGTVLELVAFEDAVGSPAAQRFATIPLDAPLPACDIVHSPRPLVFETDKALADAYPAAAPPEGSPFHAWALMPLVVGGAARALGAVCFAFGQARTIRREDRELLAAMMAPTSLALDRCLLLEAERRAREEAEASRLREQEQAIERAHLIEALRASEERLKVALSAARAATWRVDLATMDSTRDESFLDLVGIREEHGKADYQMIHPDDRAIARAHFERSLREGVPYEPEVRMRRGDGSYFWVRAHGRMVYASDGSPAFLAGVMLDIDEAKRASIEAESQRRINDTLHRLGTSFASELEHERLSQLITGEVAGLLRADLGGFLEPDGESHLAVAGEPNAALAASRALLRDPRIADALATGAVAKVDELSGHARLDGTGLRSALAVRVAARSGEAAGVLIFASRVPAHFTSDDERLVAGIATQASVALENARLYRMLREQKEQLERAVERARTADRRKDEFLAMLGHELRNPLAPIVTALALMSQKSPETLVKERAVIARQVDHLARLVDDLLDVSRITRGKIQLAKEPLEIASVLSKATEMVSPLLERRRQRLTVRVPATGLIVDADPTRLAQVFQNLLINASKYSDVGSEIELSADGGGEGVVVEVRDHGIGIDPELAPRVFDLFIQGEQSLARSGGGLGIGLAVAKSLCALHGASIAVESEGPGKGSKFAVSLPRAARASAPPLSSERTPRRVADGRRVLIVDDNVDAALTMQDYLSELGHETAVAHDALAGIEMARRMAPAIAVLDIGLPVMDGYELARKLRELLGPSAVLIAVTGYGQESDRARAREAGFDHHLVKPIALERLAAMLEG